VDDIVVVPLNKVPPAALASRPGSGAVRAGAAVALSAAASFAFDANGAPLAPGAGLTYAWDLGNGQAATGPTTQAVYTEPGEYVARVTVTDQKGLSSTAQVFVRVEEAADGLTAAPAVARLNETVAVRLTLTGLGQPVQAAITLPPELAYADRASTCSPAPAYDPGARRISYAGDLAPGASCVITVTATVATDQPATATILATVSHGGLPAQDFSAALTLNPESLYLPLIRR
jgi:PKD repeat protein